MAHGATDDDATLLSDEILWRRVPPWHVVPHQTGVGRTVSSAAFDDDTDGSPMSVVLAGGAAGPDTVLAGHEGFGIVGFRVSLARELGLSVRRDPTASEPAHAVVVGRKSHGVRKRLRAGSHWVLRPAHWTDVELA